MNYLKRVISVFLASVIMTGLAACDKKNDGADADTSDTAEITTEPADPTAADIYADALAVLCEKTIYSQEIEIEMTKTVGAEVFEESVSRTVEFIDTDSDSFTAEVNEEKIIGSNVIKTEEIYSSGTVYLKYKDEDEALYSAEMTKDDYIARHLPLALLDASLYASVSFDADDGGTILFEAPTAPESWLAPEYAKLNSAFGTAQLSSDGRIEAFTYTVDYRRGNTDIVAEYTVELNTSDKISVPDIPSDTASTVFENIDIPIAITDAYYYILNEPSFSCSSYEYIVSEPSAQQIMESDNFYSYGSSKADFIAKCESSLLAYTYDGSEMVTTEQELTQEFDGKTLVSVFNGGEPTSESADPSEIRSYFSTMITGLYINPISIASATVTDTGTYTVIEFTADSYTAEYYEDYLNLRLYSDPDALASVADSYAPKKINGYISIDNDSMLPSALNIDFEGTYTFGGQECALIYQVTRSFNIGDRSAYEEITGEMLPDEEPESKATPLLYEVTSPDGGRMYLFGTIHAGDERMAYLPDGLYAAFEDSDALAVEMDVISFEERLETDDELAAKYSDSLFYGDGSSLSENIDGELYTDTVIAMEAIGIPSLYIDIYLPSVAASVISNSYLNTSHAHSSDRGADMHLLRLAKESGKQILSVESEDDKMEMDSLYSDYTQECILADSVYCTRAEYMASLDELYEVWCSGDEEAIKEAIREEPDFTDHTEEDMAAYEEYNRIMTTDRDAAMLEVAKGYMESYQVVFFAVGMAHVLGETGLVDALRAEGYTVTIVEYE